MVRYISKPSRQLVIILILGMASGLPISLTASTFYIWLTEAGIRKQDVGLLALVGNFYTLKFLWAPFIDSINIPYITRKLGRRKGWAIVTQICLGISIFLMGRTSPSANLGFTVCAASLVAFFSATQDIVIDAYRIDWLDEANRSLGATCSIIGYRIGALASGAGALFLATYYDWATVYALLALIICFVALMLTFCPEPTVGVANNRANKDNWAMLVTAIKSSYEDFTSRKDWGLLLAFLALYKLGDCFAGLMTNPFLMYMGFSKMEIATIVKTYGFVATTIGVIAGGAMSRRTGDM
jgi:PAT family beta-lactamase induction signal transducer AmpG